jgi:hypothetical protein
MCLSCENESQRMNIEDLIKEAIRQDPNAVLRSAAPIFSEARRAQLLKIRRIPLLPRNTLNCKGILDRQNLVECMPKDAVCVEMGVDEGVFSKRILRFSNPRKLYLVDAWAAGRSNEEKYQEVIKKFESEIDAGQVEIVRANSVEAATKFNDASLDWIYIDTDPSYEATIKELYAYAKKMKPCGVIAGHDYSLGNWVDDYKYGVIEAVHEFCVAEDWELLFVTLDFTETQSFAIRKLSPQ